MTHAKLKGNIGELAVAKNLTQQGFLVFTELGDLSKVDLIALQPKTGTCTKIQVKYVTAKNGAVAISGRKTGPGYSFNYEKHHCDIFAVYSPDVDSVAYIPIAWLDAGKTISLRLDKPLNGSTNCRYFSHYTSLEEALRGHTHTTETCKDVGEEMVQTYNIPPRDKKSLSRPTKIDWPTDEVLLRMVETENFSKCARTLGVSDNAIRKRLKTRGLAWETK